MENQPTHIKRFKNYTDAVVFTKQECKEDRTLAVSRE